MTRQKISRNDSCPCGSDKKYKHCCYGKDIDWSARAKTVRRPLLPRMVSKSAGMSFGQFGVVDSKLRSIAKASPEAGEWKGLVERLSEAPSSADRMQTYKVIREAKVLPDEAAEFLFVWAIQWMPSEGDQSALTMTDDGEIDEERVSRSLDQHTVSLLRKFGVDDLAEMYSNHRLEFDRRHERGRQFFYGPPDDGLAKQLRARGVID